MTQTFSRILLTLFVVSLSAIVSCESKQNSGDETATAATTTNADAGAPLFDEAKTVVASSDLPTQPTRIVSLAPNMTEILFALGLGDRVVGVTNYCDYPPIVKSIPKVGGFIDPDVEMILAQKPDLVVGVTSAGNQKLPDQLTEAGLSYVFMEVENIDQTREAILFLGATTGSIARAAELNAQIDKQLDAWSSELEDPPTVLVVYGHKPLVAAGPDSFAHELITRAGAKNVLTAQERYSNLDAEKLIELDPDIIVDAAMAAEGEQPPWDAFPNVTAVKNGDIIEVSDPAVMRPGPRMVKGFAEVSGAIQQVAKREAK